MRNQRITSESDDYFVEPSLAEHGIFESPDVSGEGSAAWIDAKEFGDWRSRFDSFCTYPKQISEKFVADLATFGIYYHGYLDITQCHVCQKVHNNWKKGDLACDPSLHETHCRYVSGGHEGCQHQLGAEPIWYEDRGTQCSPSQRVNSVETQFSCVSRQCTLTSLWTWLTNKLSAPLAMCLPEQYYRAPESAGTDPPIADNASDEE